MIDVAFVKIGSCLLFLINIDRLKFSFGLRIFQWLIVDATFCHDNQVFLRVFFTEKFRVIIDLEHNFL